MHPALQGIITIVIGVGACVGYFYFSNQLLDKVLYPPKGPNAGRNINRANMIRPWLFLFPALFVLGLYLAYPVFETLRLSLIDRSQDNAVIHRLQFRAGRRQKVDAVMPLERHAVIGEIAIHLRPLAP